MTAVVGTREAGKSCAKAWHLHKTFAELKSFVLFSSVRTSNRSEPRAGGANLKCDSRSPRFWACPMEPPTWAQGLGRAFQEPSCPGSCKRIFGWSGGLAPKAGCLWLVGFATFLDVYRHGSCCCLSGEDAECPAGSCGRGRHDCWDPSAQALAPATWGCP